MNGRKLLLAGTMAVVFALFSTVPAFAAPRVPGKNGTSTNWGGYAIETSLTAPVVGSVTDVRGLWTVPSVSGTTTAYSSTWVGIDGYSSRTVEQLGTDQDQGQAGASYYAWYEMYPKMPKLIPGVTVHAGDQMGAEVQYLGGRVFQLSMTNFTTGETFSTLQMSANAKRTSAEWIEEAPAAGRVLPLAQFSPTTFTQCSATVSGHTGSISDPVWAYDPITIVDRAGTPVATPSALSGDGASFTITRN